MQVGKISQMANKGKLRMNNKNVKMQKEEVRIKRS